MSSTILKLADMVGHALVDAITVFDQDADQQQVFLMQLGYPQVTPPASLALLPASLDQLITALGDLDDAANDLDAGVGTDGAVGSALEEVLAGVAIVVTAVEAAAAAVGGSLPNFDRQLFGFCLAQGLSAEQPVLFAVLVAAGVINDDELTLSNAGDPQIIVRPVVRNVSGERLLSWFKSPKDALAAVYGWGTPSIDAQRLFKNLQTLLRLQKIWPVFEYPSDKEIAGYAFSTDADQTNLPVRLSIPVANFGGVVVSLDVTPVPLAPSASVQDLALTLDVSGQFNQTFQLNDLWSLGLALTADVGEGVGLLLHPGGSPRLIAGILGSNPSSDISASAQLTLTRTAPDPSDASVSADQDILTISDGSALRAKTVSVSTAVSSVGGAEDLSLSAAIKGGALVIATSGGDGFLSSVLPAKGLSATFDASISWSARNGVRFNASAGLEATLPLNVSFAGISITGMKLKIVVDNGIDASFRTTVAVNVGPVAATVTDVGAHLDLALKSGNLGFFDASAGFAFPSGVGISVNAGPVSGGGFIAFDPDAGRYSGALALQVYSVAVKAFGVIDTKLPAGGPSFSFFIIISAEFQPIQLGFGFTLLGVGGLLGINRGLDTTALEAAVKSGSIDNILFPKNPIKDAPTILADVESIFPATSGTYAFGPLARIGWGTPAIIDARVGIVLIFPGTKIALLGVVTALLPPGASKALALVEIHLDVDGVLDFPKKHFEMDAELHDSQVRGFPISGEMAARMDWGTNPNFAVSLGGFNPHYTPPSGFPTLRRLSIDLGIKGNPSATLQGYVALTSNTAQVGAALDVKAHAGGANLSGGLAFDALFVFSPFSFDASLSGGVHVDFHGVGFGMHFDGEISGPAPWHLHGDVSVSVLWFSASVGFDLTLGGESKPELPAIDIWAGSAPDGNGNQDVPGLQSAVVAAGNWTGLLPPNGYQVVTITQNDSTHSRVDPLGKATFQQKVVPLALSISKFAGRNRAKNDVTKIAVQTLSVNGTAVPAKQITPVQDFFAPAQYQKVPDSQALSSPSYQQFQGGFSFSSDDIVFGTEQTQPITMQTVLIGTSAAPQPYSIPNDATMQAMTSRSASGTGGLRKANIDRFVDLTATAKFALAAEAYALVLKTTLARFSGSAAADSAYALQADQLAALTPDVRATLQIVPVHEVPA